MEKELEINEILLGETANTARVMSAQGKVADYIPELALVSPDLFSISCFLRSGELIETGDTTHSFTMQSISKIIALSFAIEQFGVQTVFRHVGMEASADSFNSLMRIEMTSSKPSNPFMNAGAIAVCSLIYKAFKEHSLERLLDFFMDITGIATSVNEAVFASEKRSADRNRALAYFMKSMGLLHGSVEEILDLYFRLCSLQCTTRELAVIGETFAEDGFSTATGKVVLGHETVTTVLGLMSSCGLYNGSGEFAVRVGIPGKSGVCGGVLAVVPGRMGISVFSPALDEKGNSVAGVKALELLSEKLNLRRLGK